MSIFRGGGILMVMSFLYVSLLSAMGGGQDGMPVADASFANELRLFLDSGDVSLGLDANSGPRRLTGEERVRVINYFARFGLEAHIVQFLLDQVFLMIEGEGGNVYDAQLRVLFNYFRVDSPEEALVQVLAEQLMGGVNDVGAFSRVFFQRHFFCDAMCDRAMACLNAQRLGGVTYDLALRRALFGAYGIHSSWEVLDSVLEAYKALLGEGFNSLYAHIQVVLRWHGLCREAAIDSGFAFVHDCRVRHVVYAEGLFRAIYRSLRLPEALAGQVVDRAITLLGDGGNTVDSFWVAIFYVLGVPERSLMEALSKMREGLLSGLSHWWAFSRALIGVYDDSIAGHVVTVLAEAGYERSPIRLQVVIGYMLVAKYKARFDNSREMLAASRRYLDFLVRPRVHAWQ